MAITDADVTLTLKTLTNVESVQSEEESEATPEENTDADLSFEEFESLHLQAQGEIANDLKKLWLTATDVTDTQTQRLRAYLISDYLQTSQPDFDAAKIQYNEDSSVYHHANRKGSSYYVLYLRTLENIRRANDDFIDRKAGVFIT